MNGYERMMTALRREQPDRVPVVAAAVSQNVMDGMFGAGTNYLDFIEKVDADGLLISGQDGQIAEWRDSNQFRDEWGVIWQVSDVQKLTYPRVGSPIEPPIRSESDLDAYHPPDMTDERRWEWLKAAVERFKGEKAIIFMDFEAWRISYCLRGMTQLLMDLALNPAFAKRLLDMVAVKRCESIRIAFELGADILMTADDYAFKTSTLMSPAHFDEFILPYIREKAELAHELGAPYIKHSDGNLWSTLDKLVEAGVDCVDPLEPVAGMDIGDVKEKYGDRIALEGNVDVSMLLPYGTPEEVEEAVKETIAKAAPGGGFILRDSNAIHESVSPMNYRAMLEANRRWGTYPLDPKMVEEYRQKSYIDRYLSQ